MRSFLLIVTLATVLTGLNAVKPVHIDDAVFYFNAAQIASHPLDPYGYVLLHWKLGPLPALHSLAPPVLPYWWAAAIRIFGDRPALWKLWLFPFALIFVASLAALLRRFAPSVATPLLILLVLCPLFLPSLNLMMDIPALALSLLALVLFFRACDRNSLTLAVLAGLTAGLAMQTKYTAFLAPAIVLIYALLQRKFRLGSTTALIAGLIFAAWETALFFRYGESHFVYQIIQGDNDNRPKSQLIGGLCSLLGGSMPTLALLALTVLRWPRWLLFLSSPFVFLPYFLLAWPDVFSHDVRAIRLAHTLFDCIGAGVLLGAASVARRLLRRERRRKGGALASPSRWATGKGTAARDPRTAWFLILWLGLEIASYIAISPFPAVRRIMGITIAATLLLGRLAERVPLKRRRRNALYVLAGATALLGLGFFAVDYQDARVAQQAAYLADHLIRQQHPQATIWYAGFWGFQFYAEQCGMKQIVPFRSEENQTPALLAPSHFHRGDWIVIPGKYITQQKLDLSREELITLKEQIFIGDAIPLATFANYYNGIVPIRHHRGPRFAIALYCVQDDCLAR